MQAFTVHHPPLAGHLPMSSSFHVIALGLALSLVQAPAQAESPSAASLDKLLAVTQAEKLTDSVVQQVNATMRPMMEQALETKTMTAEQRERANKFMSSFVEKMNKIMADELSWDRMKAMNLQIYGEAFTQQEVDDLIVFYESPTGKAFVEKMPLVMQKSMTLMQQRMGPMMARIQAAAKQTADEFKSQQTPAPAPDAASAPPPARVRPKVKPLA
jgi:uncharacterized protein